MQAPIWGSQGRTCDCAFLRGTGDTHRTVHGGDLTLCEEFAPKEFTSCPWNVTRSLPVLMALNPSCFDWRCPGRSKREKFICFHVVLLQASRSGQAAMTMAVLMAEKMGCSLPVSGRFLSSPPTVLTATL